MLCPHCDYEINDDGIDALDGICPMCEGSLSKSSSMWDDPGDHEREYNDNDFDDEFNEEEKVKTQNESPTDDENSDDIDSLDSF